VSIVLQANLTVNSIVSPSSGFWCRIGVRDQSGGNFFLKFVDQDNGALGTAANQFRTPGQPFGGSATDFVIQSEEGWTTIAYTGT
jgi:hypothetical protein